MKIEFRNLGGEPVGYVSLVGGQLVATTPPTQRLVDDWLRRNDGSPEGFIQKFTRYNSGHMSSRAVSDKE